MWKVYRRRKRQKWRIEKSKIRKGKDKRERKRKQKEELDVWKRNKRKSFLKDRKTEKGMQCPSKGLEDKIYKFDLGI